MTELGIKAAEAAFSAGKLDDAEELSRKLLIIPDQKPMACHLLGVIALQRGDPKQALEWMERALSGGLVNVVVLNNCGEAYRQLGQLNEAYIRFERALKIDNTNPYPHFNLGLVMRSLGHAPEAEHFFRTALALDSGMARAHNELAELYRQEGHWLEAEAEYRSAIVLSASRDENNAPGVSQLWKVRLASLLRERGRPIESVDILNEVLRDNDQAAAHYEMARAQFELCWQGAAMEHYIRSTQLQPVLGLHNPARVVLARLTSIKDWCQTGGGRYVSLARSHHLLLPSLKVNPPLAASSFVQGPAITPELACASIDSAEVLPRDFVVLCEGNLFAGAVVNWFQHYPQRGYFVRHEADDARVLLDLPAQSQHYEGSCILLGGAADHYAWLYECLARLWVVEQIPAFADLPLVVPANLSEERLAMLDKFGIARDRLLGLPDDRTLLAQELHVPCLLTVGDWISPMALQFLRRRFRAEAVTGGRRIYFSREGYSDRRLANEAELLSLFDRYGFEVIKLAGRTPIELMVIFSEAQAVIAMDDDAMANLVVSPQGARVGIIATAGAYRPRAHFICGQLAQNLTYLVGETVFESNSTHALCDVRLPKSDLLAFMQEVDSSRSLQ
jgi:capsular polysaccharide biosynthesis protein/Tfp pilus assembly protein PilF